MRRAAVLTLVFSVVALAAPAQPATIAGRVVADETGSPLPNARVGVVAAGPGAPVVLTDGDGRFSVPLSSGSPRLHASKTGYAGTSLVLGSTSQPIEIRLQAAATISGRVVDELGDPVVNARIAAEVRSSSSAAPSVAATTETDDRGEYRLTPLARESYVVSVMRIGNMAFTAVGPRVPLKRYYPGVATSDEAQDLRLQPGDDRSDVDFVLPAEAPLLPPVIQARAARGEASPSGTSTVRGTVSGNDGRGVPRAQVTLRPDSPTGSWRIVRADNGGGFEFRDVAAGTYRVGAAKEGYASLDAEGKAAPPRFPAFGSPFELSAGETRDKVDVRLTRWGSVSGRVYDELGDPLQGALVQLLQIRYEAGRRRLVPAIGQPRVTDDLGRYHLFDIPPGQYVVSATAGMVFSADLPGYARTYFPGTPNAGQAQFVPIAASQQVVAIDFSLTRTRTARISGKLLNAAGESTTAGSLTLAPSQRAATTTSVPVGARILSDGTFEFPNVPPGQYVIRANRDRSNASSEGEFGTLPVAVDGADVTGLVLQTSAGSTIRGRFTFDAFNNTKLSSSGGVELWPIPADFDLAPTNVAVARIQPDWTFELTGINGPRRLELLRAPAGWALKEIRVNGIDVTDRPLSFGRRDQSLSDVEVIMTDRVGELKAAVLDDRGAPAARASVVVFAANRDRWYPESRFLQTAAAGADGVCVVAGLPFGTYYAAAVGGLPPEGDKAWQDPQFLETLAPRASTVTIGDGQKQSLSLRLAPRAVP